MKRSRLLWRKASEVACNSIENMVDSFGSEWLCQVTRGYRFFHMVLDEKRNVSLSGDVIAFERKVVPKIHRNSHQNVNAWNQTCFPLYA